MHILNINNFISTIKYEYWFFFYTDVKMKIVE